VIFADFFDDSDHIKVDEKKGELEFKQDLF